MILRPPSPVSRRGVVALELATVLPFILILLFGVWDVGRIVEVQQLVNNAAREGARLAAVGTMLDPTTGNERDIYAADVQQIVVNYLNRNGLKTSGIVVEFSDLTNAVSDPYLAQHLDHLEVTVQLPADNFRFILVNNFSATNTTVLTGVADWVSMKDSQVIVSTTLPIN